MNKKTISSFLYAIPLMFIMGIFPLIIVRIPVQNYTSAETWAGASGTESDFFLYAKMFALYGIGVLILILFLIGVCRLGMVWSRAFYLLILYAVLVLASSLLSAHSFISFRGMTGLFQPVGIVFCYLLLFFFSCWYAQKGKPLIPLFYALAFCLMLFGVIGISQFFGYDLLSRGLVKSLLGGQAARVRHFIYLTLYHWNYVGSFAALVLPVCIAMFLHRKRRVEKVVWGILFYLMVFCLCGSQSRTGMIGIIVAFAGSLWIFRKKLRSYKVVVISVVVSVLAIQAFCNWYITDSIWGKWNQVIFKTKTSKKLSYIITGEKDITIRYAGKTMKVSWTGEKDNLIFSMKDAAGHSLPVQKRGEMYSAENTVLKKLVFNKEEIQSGIYGFTMTYGKSKWRFTNQYKSDGYYYLNLCGKFDKIRKADTALPAALNGLASLRGYVWSRTIPILKDYLLLGAGADNFAYVFPQDDYVARYKYQLLYTYYKKPHNWYLQMAVESGGISLLAMLLFWGWYLRKGLRMFRQNGNVLQGAIWFSVLGYLVTAFFNDSFLTVAPVFWVLAGLGMGISMRKSKESFVVNT